MDKIDGECHLIDFSSVAALFAHRLDVQVTQVDADVFLSDGYFKAMRIEGAKPGLPSLDPLDILEAFAQHASTTLGHEFSTFGAAFSRAYDDLALTTAECK